MKLLLVGSQGQVGQELSSSLKKLGNVISWSRHDIDLCNINDIIPKITALHPDAIINAAAYTAVDKAETEPELAYRINRDAPEQMALAAQKCGTTLIHISTDYVFDGLKGLPYKETDETNPGSVYGASKLAGEEAIQRVDGKYVILRTAWVHGAQGKGNFVKTILRLAKERALLTIVEDQVSTPTWAQDIANTITTVLPALDKNTYGVYHCTNSGVASWYDLAIAAVEEARHLGVPLKVKEIKPITTEEYPLPAKRPAYSAMSNVKLRNLIGTTLPYWRDSLRSMLTELYS
ncbi:MAG: dTDP-4-dehydrorhamnose reductase [Cyanobacteria bacterium P01_D01_bin.156]